MKSTSMYTIACAVAALAFTAGAAAQDDTAARDDAAGVRHSLSLQAGYAVASGEWTAHPYAPVTLLGQDFIVGGEIAFRLSDNLALAATGLYSKLNTSEWDEYARSRGDDVRSSASAAFIGILLRPYLKNTPPDLLSFDFGPVLFFGGGTENFAARRFEYDFLGSPVLGGLAAVEYDRMLGADYSLFLRLSAIYARSAVEYSGDAGRDLLSFPVTAGARIFF